MRAVVYGAGGHGKVVADILRSSGHIVVGFLDDGLPLTSRILGLPVLGGGDWLKGNGQAVDGVALGIGSNPTRAAIVERVHAAGVKVITAIHATAVIAESATIGEGTVIMAEAVVNPEAVVGVGVIINTAAIIEHDCRIGDYAHISPGAKLGGTASVGAFTHVGIGAVISNDVAIGCGSLIGAGSVVVQAIADGVIAYGVPARARRANAPTSKTKAPA